MPPTICRSWEDNRTEGDVEAETSGLKRSPKTCFELLRYMALQQKPLKS